MNTSEISQKIADWCMEQSESKPICHEIGGCFVEGWMSVRHRNIGATGYFHLTTTTVSLDSVKVPEADDWRDLSTEEVQSIQILTNEIL